MPKPKPTVAIYVTLDERERIRIAAARRGQSMSEFCRDAALAAVGQVETEAQERGR